jgi:acylphosphatase
VSGGESRERRVVHFRGQVQGVGFRYTAARIAGHFDVNGYVQNLPDGRVLVVAEGRAAELDRLLQRIQVEMGRYIRDANTTTGPASGEFQGFDVRY